MINIFKTKKTKRREALVEQVILQWRSLNQGSMPVTTRLGNEVVHFQGFFQAHTSRWGAMDLVVNRLIKEYRK